MPIELQIADGVAELAVHGAFEEFSSGTVSGPEMLLQRVREVAADPRLERDVCLRVCDADEALTLNNAYRGGSAPTNILSFTHFGSNDVVRHPLVQRIVDAYEAFTGSSGNSDGQNVTSGR